MKSLRPLVGFTVLAFLVAGGAGVTSASADQVMCTNDVPTMLAITKITRGTNGDDVIWISNDRLYDGTAIVYGRGGNDVICGSRFGDQIHGGSGDDLIYGVGGKDVIWGDGGADIVYGGAGRDRFKDFTEIDGWSQD
jgi:Ca2+-binding RTX toxin-like protein